VASISAAKRHRSVARGLGPDQAAAPVEALAGEHTGELIPQLFVHAEQISDLPAAHTDIAGGDIGVLADVPEEFAHEALAEPHDFKIGFALGIKVRPPFAPAHGKGGQGVLEDLFKGQEFQDRKVDRGMKPQPPLVGADGAELISMRNPRLTWT
jgi:hypothetical protein